MKKFLLLIMLMCVMGGVKFSQLNAQETVTIGTGTSANQYLPVYDKYNYSVSQSLYSESLLSGLPANATIKSISFFVGYGGTTTRNISVYLKDANGATSNTKQSYTEEEKVFEGEATINENGDKLFTITFQKDYVYSGKGFFIYVNDHTGTNIGNSYHDFKSSSLSGGTLRGYSNSSALSEEHLTGNTNLLSNIQITYVAGGTQEPTPPTVTLTSPENGATDVFNPSLNFTLANADQYQILMAEGTNDFSTLQDWTEGNGSISYQTNLLKPNTTYSWKVVATNEDGTTTSDVYTFKTKAFEAPGALTAFSPANGATDLINPNLTWTFGADTEQQQVILDEEIVVDWTNIGTKLGDTYQTNGLAAGEHTWQVNVRNGAGETTGAEYSFTVASLPENVTPVSPENGATNVSSKTIKWQFAENTTHYRFLYGEGANELAYCGHGTTNTWLEVTTNEVEVEAPYFVTGKTYYWAVDVKNSVGKRSVHQNVDGDEEVAVYSFTTASTLAVSNTAPVNGATNLENPVLGWNYVGNAQQYQVYLGTDENNLPSVTEWTAVNGTNGSYQTEGLDGSTKYFWRVDVKDEGGNVIAGEVWSFVTTLPAPTNVAADPVQIVPTLSMTYGSTTISWDNMAGATGYNVYLGTTKLNAELLTATEYEIAANTMKLSYNMDPGYDIYVEAVYSLGTSISEAVNVKVTGVGNFTARIYSVDWYHRLAGATVTLACTEDEFGNVYENGEGRQYTFTTNANGDIFEEQMGEVYTTMKIYNGTYAVSVEKAYYESFETDVTISNGQTTALKETDDAQYDGVRLNPNANYIFTVTPYNATFESIDVYIDASVGQYYVYLKEGETITGLGVKDFVNDANSVAYFKYDGWGALGKGSYQFGVAKAEDQTNWSEEIVTRNYDVFETEGSWSETANWRDNELPGENAEVYLLAAATIAAEEEINVENINIQTDGSLTINGSLTANNVYNAKAGDVIINDGAQLRQNNSKLNAKFVMNIINPTAWTEDNITGWQFIASPFTNAAISQFTGGDANYDLFKYDGNQALWVNQKDINNNDDEEDNGDDNIVHKSREAFEAAFVNARGYLASYESATTATLSGTVNNVRSYDYTTVSYDAENKWVNFHLLGNPFTFDMDWDNVIINNMIEGYAVLNEQGSGYKYLTGGTIKVGNGFFVKATAENPTISYSEGTKVRRESNNSINLIATSKAGKDNVIINFAGKSEGFDKLQNFDDAVATVFVADNGKRYGIANIDENATEVELSFVAKQMGNYTIAAEPNGKFSKLILVDRFNGVETNLLIEDYHFTATSNDNYNRFILNLEANGQEPTANDNFVYQSGEELIVNAEGTIQIIDVMGRMVYSSDAENGSINVSNLKGSTYIVRNISENGIRTQKIVIL